MFEYKWLIVAAVALIIVVSLIVGTKYSSPKASEEVISVVEGTIAPETGAPSGTTKTALFAGGCFWCTESDIEKVVGVISATSGYAGGTTDNPTYENYAAGGHREVVEVLYDPSRVSYANLVENIIKHGDPTDPAGSFQDRGEEYAPAIYFETKEEESAARDVITRIDEVKIYEKPLTIIVIPRVAFWPAEEYHQDYAKKNPIRYNYYRSGSGRDAFIKKHWGDGAGLFTASAVVAKRPVKVEKTDEESRGKRFTARSWDAFVKPSEAMLRAKLTPLQYEVTQEEGTEKPFANEYDKNTGEGIYVDIVSGEPLFFSKDKYDSGTGWPSFVKPISLDVVTLKEDDTLFFSRTEVRSRYADSHIGHVFDDGPVERGGKRYCMNSAALRFVPKATMEQEGYGYLLSEV